MSDLHIDSNNFTDFEITTLIQTLQEKQMDHLHIAGDISNDFNQISRPFLQDLQKHFSLSYNLGNHDMLGMSEKEIQTAGIQVQDFGKVVLLSLAGWYDYTFVPGKSEEEHQRTKRLYWFDRRLDRKESDPLITDAILADLEQTLQKQSKPIILALHFVPHEDFILRHPYFERFNAFLGSPRFHQLFRRYPINHVVFGHTHHRFDSKVIDGIHYHARPLGYIREWKLCTDFLDAFPHYRFEEDFHPYKRYRKINKLPEFAAFKKKQLKNEFQAALTIIEL